MAKRTITAVRAEGSAHSFVSDGLSSSFAATAAGTAGDALDAGMAENAITTAASPPASIAGTRHIDRIVMKVPLESLPHSPMGSRKHS